MTAKKQGFLARAVNYVLNRGGASGELSQRTPNGQGLLTPLFGAYEARSFQPEFIEALREAIPIFDAMIDRLVTLDGVPVIVGEDTALVAEIQQWAKEIQVNDVQKGLTSFSHAMRNEVHEQGFSITEHVFAADGHDIVRLNVPDSKALRCGREDDGSLAWYFNTRVQPTKTESGMQLVLESRQSANVLSSFYANKGFKELDMRNKVYMAYTVENASPYGVSRLRSMPFVAKAIATIQNGIANTHERFGDPSYHINYKAAGRVSSEELESRRKDLASQLGASIQAKRDGKSVEFATAVDKDSDVSINVIGADGQVLEIEAPARHLLEQVVAKSGLPAWLLGLHFSTAERLAKFQMEILKQESDTRTNMEAEVLEDIIIAMLRARGRTWSNETTVLEDGSHVRKAWRVIFQKPNLADLVAEAQAKFMNAQADAVKANAGLANGDAAKPVDVSEGKDDEETSNKILSAALNSAQSMRYANHGTRFKTPIQNLETRPIDNPSLDKIEKDALKGMDDVWSASITRMIVKLGLDAQASNGLQSDGFTFTQSDKALIAGEMTAFITALHENETLTQGALAQAYLRAWSLGVLDAFERSSLDRPTGELSNLAAVNQLLTTSTVAFDTFTNNTLTPAIHSILKAGMDAGENPLTIAGNLRRELDGARWKWEQIARTETALAWDEAKRGEWQAEIADSAIDDLFDFIPAPDGCPTCQSQAIGNPRPLNETPKPVVNTHPSCRCDVAPHI